MSVRFTEISGPVDVFFRVFPPTAGALLASLLALVFFTVYTSIPGISSGEVMQFSGFLLFGVTFVSALLANVIAVVFLTLANPGLYGASFRKAVTHIFFVTVGLFALCSPLYLVLSVQIGFVLTQFLMPFSAIAAALLFELCHSPGAPLRAGYKGIFAGMVIVLATFLIFTPTLIPQVMMPFFLMPIAWLLIPLVSLIVGLVADLLQQPDAAD